VIQLSNSAFSVESKEQWRAILLGDHPTMRRGRRLFGMLPTGPRCKICNAPFHGLGGVFMRMIGRGPFEKNPNFCKVCLTRDKAEGVEIEISMMFADVRGSTGLAEGMSPSKFTRLMNRFFKEAMKVMVRTDAWIDRMIGDEVVALYIPAFAGKQHAAKAVAAACDLLAVTGNTKGREPWVPIGVGVHTGKAYVGLVGSEGGVSDITAMGDAMNIAARITSLAKPGEALVTQRAFQAAGIEGGHQYDHRHLELKGRDKPVEVHVLNADSFPG
jgi:adenylate cyclase